VLIRELIGGRGAIFTCKADEPIMDVARVLATKRIGAMPVMDDTHTMIGMLSERDIVRALVDHGGDIAGRTVSEVMSRRVITCGLGNTLVDAAALMHRYSIRHLPIVDDGLLVGMLSLRDVLKLVEPSGSRPMLLHDSAS